MSSRVSQQITQAMFALITFGVGATLALFVFPHGLIFDDPSYWNFIRGDNAANWIGYEAFARDDWHWPLFRTKLLAPPEGINIIFTDPIPALALIGKAVFKATGDLPNYFGLWLILAYGLQSMLAYCLLRELCLTNLAALTGSILFLLMPCFIYRFGHFPILAHWTLLAALLQYFAITIHGSRIVCVFGATYTLALIFINPYLLVMAAFIYFAALADGVLFGKVNFKTATSAAVVLILAVIVTVLLLGIVEIGKPILAGPGFTTYSMNLLSPIVPQLSAWPGHENYIVDATKGGQRTSLT